MAETIVNFVLGKLGDAVLQEALLLYGVDEQVEIVGRELGQIQAFLKDADKKQIMNERQKYWVREVREVAYSIEDVIDTFLAEFPEEPQQASRVRDTVERMVKKTKKMTAVHKLTDEISRIQTRLKEIEESRVRYGIKDLGDDTGVIELPIRPVVIPDVDPEVVGFETDLQHVVNEFLDENKKRRSVVSIWGPGGLGKTTLAQKAYNTNDVKTQFKLRIWFTISQKFELIDILRKIGQELELPIEQLKTEDEFLLKIHKFLRGQKYLIVFDDVWSKHLWIKIGPAFPEENIGSRVLLTTRSFDVAKDADPMCIPYKLGFLTKELGLQLLLKKALPNKSAFDDLIEVAKQFVKKCGGLPLALGVIGGILAKKPRNYTAWSDVLRTMNWHVDGKMCSDILNTSYDDLPLALKSCFMYFAAFPEDHIIEAESLIQMWIAEGFIPQENNRTLEETAESFLEDLAQRSLVQVTRRNISGSIEQCRIHDLMRDLAVQKAEEDNFLVVYSCENDQGRVSKARRVAIHHQSDCQELKMSSNLRTMLCFEVDHMPKCSERRLLKVITSNSKAPFFKPIVDMGEFEGLIQLRFLELGRGVWCQEEYWPKVIGPMRNLQTIRVSPVDSNYMSIGLPDCIWHINTLRHVKTTTHFNFQIGKCTILPLSKKLLLKNLQTLGEVSMERSGEELPQLPNLRILQLCFTSLTFEPIVSFLSTLEHLTDLALDNRVQISFPLEILNMRRFPFYQRLQKLKLSGGINTFHVDMFPPHITCLNIWNYEGYQDIMQILQKLPSLKSLGLGDAENIKKMRCSAGGFAQLEYLKIYCGLLGLEEWEIEENAMPILKSLFIEGLFVLPQGLRNLTNLQELAVNKKHEDEFVNLCKHVPSVTFSRFIRGKKKKT